GRTQQQDQSHPAARIRTARRRVFEAQDPHVHAASALKMLQIYPHDFTKTQIKEHGSTLVERGGPQNLLNTTLVSALVDRDEIFRAICLSAAAPFRRSCRLPLIHSKENR